MRHTLLYLALFVLSISAVGQTIPTLYSVKRPYILVDSFVTEISYMVLSKDKIESVNVLKDSNAVAVYGNKAKYGAVIIKTKPNTTLLNTSSILNKYKIVEADRKLRFCINQTIVNHPELILIDADEIQSVEITTEINWINAEDANSTERVINIKTFDTKKNGL